MLYGLVVGLPGPKVRIDKLSTQSRRCSPSRVQPRISNHVFGVEIDGHQDRQSSAEIGGKIRSDQLAGRRLESRNDINPSAGQYISITFKWVKPERGTEC